MILKAEFTDSKQPLFEYPRPQMKRNSYFCLNGEWDYAITKTRSAPKNFQGKIKVPYSPESSLSGVNKQLKKDEFLHLRCFFTLPKDFNKGRVFLNVGACDQQTEVYLNGKYLALYNDGYTSFTVELDNIVDGENQLYFIVTDDADSDIFGRGKQRYKRGGIWYTAISGIWQTVFIESTPKTYVKDFKYITDFDNKLLTVKCEVVGLDKKFSVEILDDDKVICEGFSLTDTCEINVENLLPWSPDNPNLYKVIIKAGDDKVESYYGLRKFSKIKIKDKYYFAINNKPIFLNGLLDQGYYHQGIYTPPSNRAMFEEIKLIKEMGYNMLRKHIKKEPMLWYYYCDILGVVVWQDMINGGKQYPSRRIVLGPFVNLHLNDKNYKSMGRDNPKSRDQYITEANRLIDQLFNVTSLYLWTPFNEGWGQFDAVNIYDLLLKKDGTRLYDHASGWQDKGAGDVLSKHIYFKKIKLKNDGKRVLALTEFGGYTYLIKGHTFTNKKFGYKSINSQIKLQKALEDLYTKQVIPMIKKQGLCATVYTQVSDVEDEINGLFTYDRVLKVDKDFIKSLNDKIYLEFNKSL